MPDQSLRSQDYEGRRLKLDTLVRLRWLAIAGQTASVVVVRFWLGFPMQIGLCLAAIALSAWLNLFLKIRYPSSLRLSGRTATLLLGYDVLQLSALLYLTGGLQNPFSILILVPVMVSATTLAPRLTVMLGALVIVAVTVLGLWHMPLPWAESAFIALPFLYILGVWVALTCAVVFMGVYAFRVAEESRQLADALMATELVLAREQHLSALDGLAAAAAHELGTPLATIALVAKELERALTPGPHDDDMKLLREQVARCREILKTLTSLDEGDAPFERMAMRHMLEEIVAPHRNFGVALEVAALGDPAAEPSWLRNPSVLYGIGNIVENAVDFARSRVTVTARWDADRVEVEVADDGPGFAPEIIDRLGEPYVSSRAAGRGAPVEAGGLGLGFFIAKTLLERSGAQLKLRNAPPPLTGARIRITWPRARFAAPPPEGAAKASQFSLRAAAT